MFCVGALRNVELAPKIYPGWELYFWVGEGVPDNISKSLVDAGAVLRPTPTPNPMIGRFFVHDDPEVDRYLIRDTDSRLNHREAGAVNEWIDSGWSYHVIRDHPGHACVIPGGLWGGRTYTGVKSRFKMRDLLSDWTGKKGGGKREVIYNNDQLFLRDMVWPYVQDDCLQNDFCTGHLFRGAHPFPAKFGDWRFCGERILPNEQPESFSWEKRMNWMIP